jgi:hypothetical protein
MRPARSSCFWPTALYPDALSKRLGGAGADGRVRELDTDRLKQQNAFAAGMMLQQLDRPALRIDRTGKRVNRRLLLRIFAQVAGPQRYSVTLLGSVPMFPYIPAGFL